MIKPWTIERFPKDRPVYVRSRSCPTGGMLIVNVAPEGVNVIYSKKGEGDVQMKGIGWAELAAAFEQLDGSPCGIR